MDPKGDRMANLVTIVVQLPPLVVRALEDFHKLVSALLNSTVLDDVHKIASALHDKGLRADVKRIASAMNDEDLRADIHNVSTAMTDENLRADIHNVSTAMTDENLLESIGRLAVVSHQLRSELEPVLRTLPLLQRGTDSVEFLGDAAATLLAQTDALVDLVPGSRFMPGRGRRRKA
jgi:hypothetical protein